MAKNSMQKLHKTSPQKIATQKNPPQKITRKIDSKITARNCTQISPPKLPPMYSRPIIPTRLIRKITFIPVMQFSVAKSFVCSSKQAVSIKIFHSFWAYCSNSDHCARAAATKSRVERFMSNHKTDTVRRR